MLRNFDNALAFSAVLLSALPVILITFRSMLL
jgi:hypothetical protein